MSSSVFGQCLLVILFMYVDLIDGKDFYIHPSGNISCPQYPCLTLSQFAANSTAYIGSDTDISLCILPGNHSLNTEFSIAHVDSFSITKLNATQNGDIECYIECTNQLGKFNIVNITTASVKGLHFIGCGGNSIADVMYFLLQDTTFQFAESANVLSLDSVVAASVKRSLFLVNSIRYDNDGCGVIMIRKSSFNIANSAFMNNGGQVMNVSESVFNITSCIFSGTFSTDTMIVMSSSASSFNITTTNFTDNEVTGNSIYYGAIVSINGSSFNIVNSAFINNSGSSDDDYKFTIIDADYSPFSISNSTFSKNGGTAGNALLDIITVGSFISIKNCIFIDNHCGIIIFVWNIGGLSLLSNNTFKNNIAIHGLVTVTEGSINVLNIYFYRNVGSFYAVACNLTFSGYTRFECGMEPSKREADNPLGQLEEGGAVTSYHSNIVFTGGTSLLNNQAQHGGAILATESTIKIFGDAKISSNLATGGSGGGLHLRHSKVEIKGNCSIYVNSAFRGGGIYVSASEINVYVPGSLHLIHNNAATGGGMYFETDSKLSVLKLNDQRQYSDMTSVTFIDNHAEYGGAVYVAYNTSLVACSVNVECFIQSLVIDLTGPFNSKNIFFTGNNATVHGSNLFGGLLDRCIPSPFVLMQHRLTDGFGYLLSISNITTISITSLPVRVYFCNTENKPDCSYQPPPVKIKKGETFTVSVVAVDQANHTISANVTSFLAFPSSGIAEGQQTQNASTYCTYLSYNVFSPEQLEKVTLYAEGPCGSSTPSTRYIDIHFLNCTCSVGFKPSQGSSSRCDCICDPALKPYITSCNYSTNSLYRDTNSWITYSNSSHHPGYVIYANCPFDYCHAASDNVSINLNVPHGADAQCKYDRTGMLCGACIENFTLSLGSSRCLRCRDQWPIVLVAIVLATIITGILLVIILLVLNMTVAVGLINGFIFYANIVSLCGNIFFPTLEPNFLLYL